MTYNSKTTLSPIGEAGQFIVSFVIEDVSKSGKPRMISAPQMIVLKGEKAMVIIGDDKGEIICTALVDDAADKPEVKTTVSVKKNGQIVWSEEKTVAMTE